MLKLVLIAALISAVAWAAPATSFIEDDAVVAEQPSFNGFAAVLRGRNLKAATHNIFAQKIEPQAETRRRWRSGRRRSRTAMRRRSGEPQNVKDLNDAIDRIIKDVVASHNASQTLINDSVKGFALCKGMPLTDKTSSDDAAAKFQLIKPAQTKEDTAAKGSINYDFGKNADTSAVAVSVVEVKIKRLQGVFDAAVTSKATAQKNYDVAHKEAVKLGAGAKSSRDVCYCTARKAYTNAVKEAKTSNGNDRLDLQHFQMVQCVMAAFAKNTTEADAFKLCMGKKYDTKVMDLDFKESEAKLPSDVTCTTPAPAPAPAPQQSCCTKNSEGSWASGEWYGCGFASTPCAMKREKGGGKYVCDIPAKGISMEACNAIANAPGFVWCNVPATLGIDTHGKEECRNA